MHPFQWVEFFAGAAEATKAFKGKGYHTARLDLLYMKEPAPPRLNPMDICTPGGFALLRCKSTTLSLCCVRTYDFDPQRRHAST